MNKLIDFMGKTSAMIAMAAIPFTSCGLLPLNKGIATIIMFMLICVICEADFILNKKS